MLSVAPRTRTQLAAALRRRGIPADAAEAVLARFTDVGLIDDAAFARAWVESRHHSRGLSRPLAVRRAPPSGRAGRRNPRGGRHPRSRPGSGHRPPPGRTEAGRQPRPAARGPRPAGGRHPGPQGLSGRTGLPPDQGSPGARRLPRDPRSWIPTSTSTPTPTTAASPVTLATAAASVTPTRTWTGPADSSARRPPRPDPPGEQVQDAAQRDEDQAHDRPRPPGQQTYPVGPQQVAQAQHLPAD